MTRLLALLVVLWPAVPAFAQQSLTASLTEVLQRVGNGHSPTEEEIQTAGNLTPTPEADDVRTAVPLLSKALANPDTPVRTFALTALTGLEKQVEKQQAAAAKDPQTPVPDDLSPAVFKPAVASLLKPLIPEIASHLTDESQTDRILTVTILGGFTPDPPASLYPPLYAYLKRDSGTDATGLGVTRDLLQLGPLSAETAAAIGKYLRRSDQTSDSRASLVEAIASAPNQSPELNKALLGYLNSDDSSLRARVILSLPALDLTPDQFGETKTRISQLAENAGENPQVIAAAKAVAPCWTATKMTSGCPVYP